MVMLQTKVIMKMVMTLQQLLKVMLLTMNADESINTYDAFTCNYNHNIKSKLIIIIIIYSFIKRILHVDMFKCAFTVKYTIYTLR